MQISGSHLRQAEAEMHVRQSLCRSRYDVVVVDGRLSAVPGKVDKARRKLLRDARHVFSRDINAVLCASCLYLC